MSGVPIGLSNVVFAILNDDPIAGGVATYEAPVRLMGAISAKRNANASNDTMFADDGPYETASTIGKISLELTLADVPLSQQATLLGHTYSGGVLVRKSSDSPPWVALGYKVLKSNGSYRFTWLAKGKFSVPDENNQTKGDSINWNTTTITGSFVKRDCDNEWERHIDEDDTDYMASMGTNWFNGPYGGAADTTAPTISSVVPADAATAVSSGTTVVWTFDEALALSTVTTANFLLINAATDIAVPGSLSINAARTIVTFTPTAVLASATDYRAVVTDGVKDLAGNAIAAASVTKFTTA